MLLVSHAEHYPRLGRRAFLISDLPSRSGEHELENFLGRIRVPRERLEGNGAHLRVDLREDEFRRAVEAGATIVSRNEIARVSDAKKGEGAYLRVA